MLKELNVPLVYVGGCKDPWMGLGMKEHDAPKVGKNFYIPDGKHCPDRSDKKLTKKVTQTMLGFSRG